MYVFFLKTELWKSRVEELIQNKSEPWDEKDMDKVLKSLKNNKTKEHNVMINEILKPGYWRRSEISFDYLFNGLMYEYVSLENISSIYKSKGSRLSTKEEFLFLR